jgi:hypothetical protein
MKKLIALVLLICILLTGCKSQTPKQIIEPRDDSDSFPFKYIIKSANDPCPEGQKMSYYHDDVPPLTKESGCQSIAADAGKICNQNSECINNCIFSINDLERLQCESYSCSHTGANCPVAVNCDGILGRCEATKEESHLTIIEQGKVLCSCRGI